MKVKDAVNTPCKGCPFAKHSKSGELGGSPVTVYVGQAHLPMWLPCHSERGYAGEESCNSMDKIGQCSGAARLRKKLGDKWGMDYEERGVAIQDDPDGKAFDSIEEFVEHHAGVKHEAIDVDVISYYMKLEMDKVKQNAHRCVKIVER
jgi:hypothetical protein